MEAEEETAEGVETDASITNIPAGAGGSDTESKAAGSPLSSIAKSPGPAVEASAEAHSEATDANTMGSKQADSTAASTKSELPGTTVNEKITAGGGNVLVEEGGGREASSPAPTVKSEANPTSVGTAAAVMAAMEEASQGVAVSSAGDQKGDANAGQANAGGDEDSSDDDDVGDGFRIVVGREREAPAAPAAPTKRFLRGKSSSVYCQWAVLYCR